jgi:hypothetical protein
MCLPDGTNWGGNTFFHNLLLRTHENNDVGRVFSWARDADCGSGWVYFNYNTLHSSPNSTAWQNNIATNPLFVDAPDSIDAWWSVKWDSPAIDAGIYVSDDIGAAVEILYPGYGWSGIDYVGSSPDIGAYEYSVDDTLGAPIIVIQPYAFYFFSAVDTGAVDTASVWVKNACLDTCESAVLSPVIIGDDRGVYTVVPLADSTLLAGDSIHIYLEFAPDTAAALFAKMVLWDGGLDTIPIYGVGADSIPDCCAFGETAVIRGITALKELDFGEVIALQTKLDTVYIANCADSALEATISIKAGTSFSIVSGGGVIEVDPYWGVEAIVLQFKPINYGALTDSLTVTGTDGCSGILLKGTGIRAPHTKTAPVPPTEPGEE